jgi:autophagy-related protein 2
MLAGLPIQLHDGSLGKVTARIPWPNPLTSSVGLALESLHLTFNIMPTTSKLPPSAELADSMLSVAETFIHDELNDYDEAAIRESIYSDAGGSQSIDPVPGGLDPFITEHGGNHDSEPPGVSIFATLVERLLARFEFDASDIRITLVHTGHSSLTLNIPSIRYHTELNNDGVSSNPARQAQGVLRTIQISGVNITTRNLRPISPQSLTSLHASQSSQYASSTTATPPRSPSQSSISSDSSDMDDDTTMMMSQSIVGLPMRPPSPASSVESSMYASAVSTVPIASEMVVCSPSTDQSQTIPTAVSKPAPLLTVTKEIEDELILSFGSEPIVLRLVAPSPVTPQPNASSSSATTHPDSAASSHPEVTPSTTSEALKLEVSIGVMALTLRAVQIRNLLEMTEHWMSHSRDLAPQTSSKELPQSPNGILSRYDASLRVRGVVTLLLPADSFYATPDALSNFYQRPLVPPHLSFGYVRLHIDNISASMSSLPLKPSPHTISNSLGSTTTGQLSIDDTSLFAFLPSDTPGDSSRLYASPIVIVDPHLQSQYPPNHVHPDLREANAEHVLPAFDVVDWTNRKQHPHSTKLTTWRTKLNQGHAHSPSGTPTNHVAELPSSPVTRNPAVTLPSGQSPFSNAEALGHVAAIVVIFSITSAAPVSRTSRAKGKAIENGVNIDVQLGPLHVFCDASLLLNKTDLTKLGEPLSFFEDITRRDAPQTSPGISRDTWDSGSEDEEEEDPADTPPSTPRAQRKGYSMHEQEREHERERQRLERLVLEDLDLEYDYRQKVPEKSSISRVKMWRRVSIIKFSLSILV